MRYRFPIHRTEKTQLADIFPSVGESRDDRIAEVTEDRGLFTTTMILPSQIFNAER